MKLLKLTLALVVFLGVAQSAYADNLGVMNSVSDAPMGSLACHMNDVKASDTRTVAAASSDSQEAVKSAN